MKPAANKLVALSGDAAPKPGSGFFFDGYASLRLALSNRGAQPLAMSGLPLIPGPAATSYAVTIPPPSTIAPGATAEMEVAFTPGSTPPSEAVLELASNDPIQPLKQVALAGAGSPVGPVLFPSLPNLNLPSNGQGTASVLLQNPGTFPMNYVIESPFDRAKIVSSTEAGGPTHSWVDIRSSGQLISFSDPDESMSDPINLGFSYPWSGGSTNQVRVCTNGYILLTGNYPITRLAPRFPNPASPAAVIGGFWMDLVVANGGTVHSKSTPSEFVIQFTNVPAYFDPARTVTFQISLYPDGRVRWRYHSIAIPTAEAVLGWQANFNGVSLPDAPIAGRSYELRQPGSSGWSSVSPTSGTIAAGGNAVVQFACNAGGLADGFHRETFSTRWSSPTLVDQQTMAIPFVLGVGPGVTQANSWWSNATNSQPVTIPWTSDSDGDGIQNGLEFALGTHPLDNISRPQLGMEGNSFAIRRVTGLTGFNLYIQTSGNLQQPWGTAAPANGGGAMVPGALSVIQDTGPGPARDTRIGALPPPTFFRLRATLTP
ncbi:MAG: hypothetical protein ACKO2G_09225 [Verrucomicrobiales bacterium]